MGCWWKLLCIALRVRNDLTPHVTLRNTGFITLPARGYFLMEWLPTCTILLFPFSKLQMGGREWLGVGSVFFA